MSYLPNDPEHTEAERRIAELATRLLARSSAKPVRIPAGHANRAQRRAFAKRNGMLHAQSQTWSREPMVFDSFDDPRWF